MLHLVSFFNSLHLSRTTKMAATCNSATPMNTRKREAGFDGMPLDCLPEGALVVKNVDL